MEWRKLLKRFALAICFSIGAMFLNPDADCDAKLQDDVKLSRKIKRQLDNVVFPAMQAGEDAIFFDAFGPMIAGQKSVVVSAIEAYAKKQNLDSPLEHLIDLKLMRIEQGIDVADEELSLRQTIYLIGGINRRVSEFLDEVQEHPWMQKDISVPEDWKQGRDLFWESHVIKNEFANFRQALDFGTRLLLPMKSRLKGAQAEQRQAVAAFEESLKRLPRVEQELIEGEAAARLARFRRSVKELPEARVFENRFVAAMNVELDSSVLLPLLKSGQAISRVELNEPGLASKVGKQVDDLRSQQADVMKKARLFRSGVHWWLRGRYGHGPLANGLLKPRSAIGSADVMDALYMPKERPVPENNFVGAGSENGTQPFFKRRHYYTWALEYRPILENNSRKVERQNLAHPELLGVTHNKGRTSWLFY